MSRVPTRILEQRTESRRRQAMGLHQQMIQRTQVVEAAGMEVAQAVLVALRQPRPEGANLMYVSVSLSEYVAAILGCATELRIPVKLNQG